MIEGEGQELRVASYCNIFPVHLDEVVASILGKTGWLHDCGSLV